MAPIIKERGYVCNPSTISINMKYYSKINSVKIHFKLYNEEAFYLRYRFSPTSDTKDYDLFLEYICKMLFGSQTQNIDNFTKLLSDKDHMKGEYVYKNLKNVKNKNGTTIWSK